MIARLPFTLAVLLLGAALVLPFAAAPAAARQSSYELLCNEGTTSRGRVSIIHQYMNTTVELINSCSGNKPGYYELSPMGSALYPWTKFALDSYGPLLNTTVVLDVDSPDGVKGVESAHCSQTLDADQVTMTCVVKNIDPNNLHHATFHYSVGR